MSMTVDEYERLQRIVKNAERELAEAEGEAKAVLKMLKEKYDVSSVEAAERLLLKIEERVSQLRKQLYNAIARFEEKWQTELEGK